MRVWLAEQKKDIGEKVKNSTEIPPLNEEKVLENLLKSLKEKIEFLIKLSPPPIWFEATIQSPSPTKTKRFMKSETQTEKVDNALDLASKRLSNWKIVAASSTQTAESTAADISYSLTSSVLTCLQASNLTIEDLHNQIEGIYIKSALKMGGMQIYNLVLEGLVDEKLIIDVANWFSTSLRKNKKVSTHYAEFVQGSGDTMRFHIRHIFFEIMNRFLSVLPNIKKVINIYIYIYL